MLRVILAAVDSGLADAWERFCGGVPFVEIYRGSILVVECDAVVSPANSFGFMDGRIDALYRDYFGPGIQERVQAMIRDRLDGELVVGCADVVETGMARIPYLLVAPTMRVPMVLSDSVNAYLAARAALLVARKARLQKIAFPGLGTGVGQLSPNTCAHQVRVALEAILFESYTAPRSWVEASERHQLLYTDRVRRLQ